MQFIGRGPARPVSYGLLDGVTLNGPQASVWLGVQTLSLCLTSALVLPLTFWRTRFPSAF